MVPALGGDAAPPHVQVNESLVGAEHAGDGLDSAYVGEALGSLGYEVRLEVDVSDGGVGRQGVGERAARLGPKVVRLQIELDDGGVVAESTAEVSAGKVGEVHAGDVEGDDGGIVPERLGERSVGGIEN